MDFRQTTLLLLISLFGYASSNCYGCNGAGEYCCGYNICCYSVYMSWWFWCILVALFLLKVSCIGCYIRARRQRASMYYVEAPVTTTAHMQPSAGTVSSRARPPPMQQQMPPPYHTQPPAYTAAQAPYNTQPPAYTAAQAGYTQPSSQTSEDSHVNKDTQWLVG